MYPIPIQVTSSLLKTRRVTGLLGLGGGTLLLKLAVEEIAGVGSGHVEAVPDIISVES